jgi:signal transduction histidine kinase
MLTLSQRLSIVFAVLLLACCGMSAWLQVRASDLHEEEVVQGLSHGLAEHIAHTATLMDKNGLRPDAVRRLFGQLMVVNPAVEVYLLDNDGRIQGDDAPSGHVKRPLIGLGPVRQFLAGGALPILGDDPRSVDGRKVFSVAPLQDANGVPSGYIYVVLQGEARDALAARVAANAILRTTLLSMALVALLGLMAGLIAFRLITRPLRRLADTMRHFDVDGEPAGVPAAMPNATSVPIQRLTPDAAPAGVPDHILKQQDEITLLDATFRQMARRIGEQWRALSEQDQERRELIANISHDLRTPLTSLHGYLETLSLKAETLSAVDRSRYLAVALSQSAKVGRLAQSLFELAKLEHGAVQPEPDTFSLIDLVQDVFQKFELAAEAREIRLRAGIPARLPNVYADVGMIERVLTNLLDNAIRHTPVGGVIDVDLGMQGDAVVVTVSDTGPGIPLAMRKGLFQRPFSSADAQRSGGLGLLIVRRMLQLHHSDIVLVDRPADEPSNGGTEQGKPAGASFRFEIPKAGVIRPDKPAA